MDAAADENTLTAVERNQPVRWGTWVVPPEAETPDDAEEQAVLTALKHAYAKTDSTGERGPEQADKKDDFHR